MFLDLSLHHRVRSSNAMRAEQIRPTVYVSIISTRLTKCFSADGDCGVIRNHISVSL